MPPERTGSWAEKEYIDHAPIWCSVDLRDGNQALIAPMTLEQKLSFFQLLVKIGFKEIEVGFPAASETEFQFVRTLIEKNLIPDDVTIQVMTQAREHIIRRTFEALEGAPRAIVQVYNAVAPVYRERVFKMSREEVKRMAVEGAMMVKEMAEEEEVPCTFQYGPEAFSAAEPEYALEVCNAVLDVWKPTPEKKAIINLPCTVELAMPHIFAGQIEYMHTHLSYRDSLILSLHPHNDRGCAVADAELGILAGAQRIEGTLTGFGERAGNLDLITMAMNLYSHGVDPGLDLSNMDEICEQIRAATQTSVPPRSPYSGILAFAAFSGTHQDAIAKSLALREKRGEKIWNIPYLPIDPSDIGRSYDMEVIRINSQSGKGGVNYVLEEEYGLKLPEKMREEMTNLVKSITDHEHRELKPAEVYALFKKQFENCRYPYAVTDVQYKQHNGIIAEVTTTCEDSRKTVVLASGNGRLNAVSNALKKYYPVSYDLVTYEEHALERSSSSRAIAYVGIKSRPTEHVYWGAGVNVDIIQASIDALLSAVNNMAAAELKEF